MADKKDAPANPQDPTESAEPKKEPKKERDLTGKLGEIASRAFDEGRGKKEKRTPSLPREWNRKQIVISWILIGLIAITGLAVIWNFGTFICTLFKSVVYPATFEITTISDNPTVISVLISVSFLFRIMIVVFIFEFLVPLIRFGISQDKNLWHDAFFNLGYWFGKNNGWLEMLAISFPTILIFGLYRIKYQPSCILNALRTVYNIGTIRDIIAVIGAFVTIGFYEFPLKYELVPTTSPQWLLAIMVTLVAFVVFAPIAERQELSDMTKKFIEHFSKKGKETIEQGQETHAVASAVASAPGITEGHGAGFFLGIALLGEYLYRAIAQLLGLKPKKESK